MNEIFANFISRNKEDDDLRVGHIMWFDDTFPDSEFTGDDLVMKKYCAYCAALEVPMKLQYFQTFMSTELKRLLIETGVRVPGTDSLNYDEPTGLETAYQVSTQYLQDQFRILETYDADVNDFKVAADSFMKSRLSSRLVDELGKTYDTLSGSEDAYKAAEYALDNLIMLRDIYDTDQLDELEDAESAVHGDFEFICDTGIPVIDDDIGGLYTCQLMGVEAQPGVGKTRMALGVWAYRCAVLYHKNVIYYQLEQSRAEAEAMLVARHVYAMYGLQVPDSMILRGRVPEELQSKVAAAKIDLFQSGKYGKIYIKHGDLFYETMTQTFKQDDKLHGPFDLIAVDYMGLIEQKPAKYQKEILEYQVISRAFRKFKRYVERRHKGGIAVSQFNQKGIDAGKSDKEISTDMAQGGIAVYRNTDNNLALSRSETMKAQQKLRVSQPKIRGTAGFGTTVIDTRLGISLFYQNTQQKL